MRAAIVSVGSELLRGALLDTNAQFFAHELTALGIQVVQVLQVGDDRQAIASALQASSSATDLVIVSGGLGPTEDDLTREALIDLTGEQPTTDAALIEGIRAHFTRRGLEMPARNEKQAWRIPSARIIRNDHGTAPGWIVESPGSTLIVVPGPPRENQPMWEEQIRPLLAPRASDQVIVSRTIKTIGIGESSVADRLGDLIVSKWPQVATYAKQDGVHVTVTASHESRGSADLAVRHISSEVAHRLEPHVYGYGRDSLAGAIVQPLAAAGVQIAIWEVGSAGSLAAMLLADPEAQGVVAEARLLPAESGNDPRFVPVREQALAAARRATRSTPVGTIAALVVDIDRDDAPVAEGRAGVALVHAGGFGSRDQEFRGRPEEIRRRAGLLAAEFLWFELRAAAGVRQTTD